MELLRQPAQNRIIVLLIAAAVDLLIGDPHWLWHPVQGIGSLIDFFEKTLRTLFSVPPAKPDTADINAASAEYSKGSGNPESPERERRRSGTTFFSEIEPSPDFGNGSRGAFLRKKVNVCYAKSASRWQWCSTH